MKASHKFVVAAGCVSLFALLPFSVDAQACKVYGNTNSKVQAGVSALCAEVRKGTPYKWGGGHGSRPGPTLGGFDCSGLARYYYFKATGRDPFGGTTADGQYNSGSADVASKIPVTQGIDTLLPGDLVYFGSADKKTHVGVYVGNGYMVEAQKTGTQIKVSSVKGRGYAGALRMRY